MLLSLLLSFTYILCLDIFRESSGHVQGGGMVGRPQPWAVVRVLWRLAAAALAALPRLRTLRAALRPPLRLGGPLHRPGQPPLVLRCFARLQWETFQTITGDVSATAGIHSAWP